jgi:ribosomal protein S18 acetylase RimI-like enzyme
MEPGTSDLVVRRIRPEDWDIARSLRLRGLADAPDAFTRTYQEESVQPDAFWIDRAAAACSGNRRATFLAFNGHLPAGIATGIVDDDDQPQLVSMWVDPALRGRRLGESLVNAVVQWALDDGFKRLLLWVSEDNDPAIRLYQRVGFQPTNRTDALRPGSDIRIRMWVRHLNAV